MSHAAGLDKSSQQALMPLNDWPCCVLDKLGQPSGAWRPWHKRQIADGRLETRLQSNANAIRTFEH
ncbi:hypothetical protein L914_10370 [Phytophthora nicotianae]|uniref:Uncharacterized protein n=2 Tax=Phytophthora nicotianae TaxID=4792 RepID=V9F0A8_PHYNI|nr:hypothetical protein F443_10777 [Phytophthora nicotianae P1569]ETM44390.1 hypothetical protein L914_10370 [Phytophthora nicotianae]